VADTSDLSSSDPAHDRMDYGEAAAYIAQGRQSIGGKNILRDD
jgi:hypothetical protein